MVVLKIINAILNLTNSLNLALDLLFLMGGLTFILEFPVYFFATNAKKYSRDNKNGELYSQTVILFFLASLLGLLWCLPEIILFVWFRKPPDNNWVTAWIEWAWVFTILRWVELALLLFKAPKLFKLEYDEKRWFNSWVVHFAVIIFGLFVDRLMGVFLISTPLLTAYYFALYSLAIILLPASNPEDRTEKWKRFTVFVCYTWGIQSPIYVVDGHAWKKLEPRIKGDFTWDFSDFSIPLIDKLMRPGLVWTPAHQAVAITGGTHFKRVEGPGIVFTGKLERPEQIFDLRLQLRTNEIDVVSKDGISFKARVFTAFRLDPETWDRETYHKMLRMDTNLRDADKPSYIEGSFPYSNLRVQATLGVTSTKADTKDAIIYWDQWALKVIEDQARKVISQKNLGELWRPIQDEKGANALNKIAEEIKNNIFLKFRSVGILLFVARIVNFSFPSNDGQTDEISQQQLATWSSEWKSKRTKILAEAEAEAERAQQEARAYAEALLLNSIAEGLQKTQEINPRLPRYVIAMRFLSALQDFIHKQSTDEKQTAEREKSEHTSGYEKKVDDLHTYLKEWQELFFSDQDRRKLP